MLNGDYEDPAELYKLEPTDDVDGKIKEMNKLLPAGQQAVRGRGKFANKIVKRNRGLNTEEVIKYTTKIASKIIPRVYAENPDEDEDELSNILQNMILNEMMSVRSPQSSFKKLNDEKKIVNYNVQHLSSDDEDFSTEVENDDESSDEDEEDNVVVEDLSESNMETEDDFSTTVEDESE